MFDDDRNQVLRQSAMLGVQTIVVPSVSASNWQKTIDVCTQASNARALAASETEQVPKLLLALGLHPVFIDQHQPQHLTELDSLIHQYKPIAVGEIGLDFYLKDLDRDKQIAYFNSQLIIAKRHLLPVIIHNRKAHDECIELLTQHQLKGGIIHAFNGNIAQAEKYIELGFLLGFGGMLTFQRSTKLRKLAATLPIDSIVLETDAPDMTVSQHTGNRNSPEYLPLILEELAEIKKMDSREIARLCTQNFTHLFLNQN